MLAALRVATSSLTLLRCERLYFVVDRIVLFPFLFLVIGAHSSLGGKTTKAMGTFRSFCVHTTVEQQSRRIPVTGFNKHRYTGYLFRLREAIVKAK